MEMRSLVTGRGLTFKFQYNKGDFAERQASFPMKASSNLRVWKSWKAPKKTVSPPTPGIFYEYQKKGVRKLAFRKCLILKETVLERSKQRCSKKKSGSKLPHSKDVVTYEVNYTIN